jgi:hypothetical protein
MAFDSVAHRDQLRLLPNYAANVLVASQYGWKQEGSGLVAVDKPAGDDAVLVVVGKIVNSKYKCGPAGNYNPKYDRDSPLSKAKFQLVLGVPNDPVFSDDFNKAFDNLIRLQNSVAHTTDKRFLATLEGHIRNISISAKMFEERVRIAILHFQHHMHTK